MLFAALFGDPVVRMANVARGARVVVVVVWNVLVIGIEEERT